MRYLLFSLALIWTLSSSVVAQNKLSLALFNLTPISIEAIGIDGDLLFSMRSELERSDVFQLMSRRDMELELSRLDGAQVADTQLVSEYGRSLGVNYILTGTIDLERTTIVVEFKLVDVVNGVAASEWSEKFVTKSELVSRAAEITKTLERNVRNAEVTAAETIVSVDTEIITDFNARVSGESVSLTWKTDPDTFAFYYNVYRGQSLNGPFEFVNSATEPRFIDSQIEESGTFYYRIGVVLDTGEEVNGATIAKASLSKTNTNRDISPPTVLSHKAYVSGAELEFVPAISNKDPMSGYQMYYREVGKAWQKGAYLKESGKLNYTLVMTNSLAPATQYEFAVTGITTSDQESPRSSAILVETPPMPILGNDEATQTRKVTLTWTPSINHAIRVYRRNTGDEQWTPVGTAASGSNQYVDSKELGDGLSYDYAIAMFDSQSESAKSDVVTASTKKLPAPTNFSVESGVKTVTLSWQGVDDPDVKGYRIYRKQGEISPDDLLEEVAQVNNPQLTQYIDGADNKTPLLDGTKYNYIVAAVNQFDGPGDVTTTETAKTKPRPGAAFTPTLAIVDNAIQVSWTASSSTDISEYLIERKWTSSQWTDVAAVPAGELSFTDTDLRPYSQTFYRIIARDADGLRSDPTQDVSIDSPDKIVLEVQQDLLLRRIELAWSEHKNIDGYQLYRRKSGSSNWTQIGKRTAVQNNYVDNDERRLTDGADYEYAVRALSADGESPQSNIVMATTKFPPPPPQNGEAIAGLVKAVEVRWAPASDPDVTGYNIYRKNNKDELELIEGIKKRATGSYLDSGSFFTKLDDGTSYTYVIRAFNRFDVEGPASPELTAQTKPVPARINGLQVSEAKYQAELVWQASPEQDISYYQIYRGNSCSSVRSIATSKDTSYIDNDTSDGRGYCYRVSAVDADKLEGLRSDGVSVTIPEKPQT